MKVLNAEQTRNLEKNAVRSGISYLQLMENAGAAAARFIKKRFPVDQKHIVVLCGKRLCRCAPSCGTGGKGDCSPYRGTARHRDRAGDV